MTGGVGKVDAERRLAAAAEAPAFQEVHGVVHAGGNATERVLHLGAVTHAVVGEGQAQVPQVLLRGDAVDVVIREGVEAVLVASGQEVAGVIVSEGLRIDRGAAAVLLAQIIS